jgi:hypothetical protein
VRSGGGVLRLLRRRQKKQVDRRRSLTGIPIIHENVTVVEKSGIITLQVKTGRGSNLLHQFRPKVVEKKYELDEFGTFVVRQMRKRKNVMAIVRAFEKKFGLSHRESELGVVAFVKMLMKRNAVSVVIE